MKEKPPNWFPKPGDLYHHYSTGLCIVLEAIPPKEVAIGWSVRVLSNKDGSTAVEDISPWSMQFLSAAP